MWLLSAKLHDKIAMSYIQMGKLLYITDGSEYFALKCQRMFTKESAPLMTTLKFVSSAWFVLNYSYEYPDIQGSWDK